MTLDDERRLGSSSDLCAVDEPAVQAREEAPPFVAALKCQSDEERSLVTVQRQKTQQRLREAIATPVCKANLRCHVHWAHLESQAGAANQSHGVCRRAAAEQIARNIAEIVYVAHGWTDAKHGRNCLTPGCELQEKRKFPKRPNECWR